MSRIFGRPSWRRPSGRPSREVSAQPSRGTTRTASRRSHGQSLVEFALVLPVFALVMFGIIDVGRYVYVSNALNEASREGARFGSVEQWQFACPAGVASPDRLTCTSAVTLGRLVGAPANVSATVTCRTVGTGGALSSVPASACGQNDLLVVQATAPDYTFFTPIIGQILGTPTISGITQAAVQ